MLYQVGSWTVDGVTVGDGDEPALAYAVVDTLQLVFTHNCEHGWIYGSALECDADGSLRPPDGDAFVQFGPEQLLARLDGDALGDGYALCDGGSVSCRRRACGWRAGEIKPGFVSLRRPLVSYCTLALCFGNPQAFSVIPCKICSAPSPCSR